MPRLLETIPGFRAAIAEAAAKEEASRELAFIDGALAICGVPIVPLTLEKTALLLLVESPFLGSGDIRPEHVLQFLWIMSPHYRPGDSAGRAAFSAAISALPFRKSCREIVEMIEVETMDRPARNVKPGHLPITCFVASWVDLFAAEYGWSETEILQTRMARLYQYSRQIERRKDPDAVFFNRFTDAVKKKFRGRGRKKSKAKPAPAADTRRKKK